MRIILTICCLTALANFCQAANYELPLGKIEAFLKLPSGNMREWARNNGTIIGEENCWNPKHRIFAVYECNNVRLWFQVKHADQERYVENLVKVTKNSTVKSECDHNPVYGFSFPAGECLAVGEINTIGDILANKKEGDKELGEIAQLTSRQYGIINAMPAEYPNPDKAYQAVQQLQGIDGELIQKFKKLLENKELGEEMEEFRAKHFGEGQGNQDNQSDTGKDMQTDGTGDAVSSKKGMKGPFPIAFPLSKWLVTMLDIVSEYLGIKEISMQVLAAAYLIAPEAFNFIGNYVGKLERLVVPKSVGDFLDNVADVVQYAKKFYDYAKGIKGLLEDPNFLKFAQNLDLGKTIKAAEPLIPDNVMKKINQYFPVTELMNGSMNIEQWNGVAKNLAWQEIEKHVCDIPRLCSFVDMPGLINCRNSSDKSKCGQEWLLRQTKDNIKRQLPDDFQRFGGAVDHLLNGKPAEAAKEALATEIAKRAGISKTQASALYELAQNGDWKNFVIEAANYKVAAFRQCEELLEAVKQGDATATQAKEAAKCFLRATGNERVAGYVDRLANLENITLNDIKTNVENELKRLQFTQREMGELLQGNAKYLAEKMAKEAGFTHPEAIEALLAGNPARALEIQMQKGWELNKTVHYQQQSTYLKQKLTVKAELMMELLNNIKNGTLKIPDDPRKFGRFLHKYLNKK